MSISLDGSLRTCKVDNAWANRMQSDRFFNPCNMVCSVWNGMDSTGRYVCPDSYYTKSAGCNSAMDRVVVENDLRPQYAEYINLNTMGYEADIYSGVATETANDLNSIPYNNLGAARANLNSVRNYPGYGNFGLQMSGDTIANCNTRVSAGCCNNSMKNTCASNSNYAQLYSQEAFNNRSDQRVQEGFISNTNKRCSGMGAY
jgi:hypothetical protein